MTIMCKCDAGNNGRFSPDKQRFDGDYTKYTS